MDYFSMLFTYNEEIERQIKEFNPDVIIGNDIVTPLLAYRLARKNGIPTIFYAIDIEHRLIPFRFLQPLGRLIESKNIRDADLAISINEGLREYTIKMGAKENRTLVLRAGIDAQKFDPAVDGNKIREKYGIGQDDFVLFFMGWLYDFSGLKEVATELSKMDNNKIKFLIVGEGDAYKDLQAIRTKYHSEDRIILTGKQPYDLLPYYLAASDICLLPAYNNEIMRDIVPIKMYEYMAMGKPVISTKLPGVMKEFREGNGVIFIEKPEDTLEKALEIICGGNIVKEGNRARKFVEKLDWESITDEFEHTLIELLGRLGHEDRNT
jgi:glycosyltransferase involved in cell wall biosynthesis